MKGLPETEAYFISRFVTQARRERVGMELADPKRRAACLMSFSEPHRERLLASRMSMLPEGTSAEGALLQLKSCGCTTQTKAYVMHISAELDRAELPLMEALQAVWFRGPAVVVCPEMEAGLILLDSGEHGTIKAILNGC